VASGLRSSDPAVAAIDGRTVSGKGAGVVTVSLTNPKQPTPVLAAINITVDSSELKVQSIVGFVVTTTTLMSKSGTPPSGKLNDLHAVFAISEAFSATNATGQAVMFAVLEDGSRFFLSQDMGLSISSVATDVLTIGPDGGSVVPVGSGQGRLINASWTIPACHPRTLASGMVDITISFNDHTPFFVDPITFDPIAATAVAMEENLAIGTIIGIILAQDDDALKLGSRASGLAIATVSYFGLENSSLFSLDSTTGDIRTKVVFDREALDKYTFVVFATDALQTDAGWNSLDAKRTDVSQLVVNITVIDINDNRPVFTSASFEIGDLSESKGPGISLLDLDASDPDLGPNGEVLFQFTVNPHNRFALDSSNGILSTSSDLAGLSELNSIVVSATDRGSPALVSEDLQLELFVVTYPHHANISFDEMAVNEFGTTEQELFMLELSSILGEEVIYDRHFEGDPSASAASAAARRRRAVEDV